MMDPSKWPRHRRLRLRYLRSFIYDGTEMERYITISGEVPARSSFTGKRRDCSERIFMISRFRADAAYNSEDTLNGHTETGLRTSGYQKSS